MRATETFATEFSAKAGLDPTTVIAIVQAILSIMQQCNQSSAGVINAVKNPNLWQRARATKIVMDNCDHMPRWKARSIAAELLNHAAEQPAEVVSAVCAECQSGEW